MFDTILDTENSTFSAQSPSGEISGPDTLRPDIVRMLDRLGECLGDHPSFRRTVNEVRHEIWPGPTVISACNVGLPIPGERQVLEQLSLRTSLPYKSMPLSDVNVFNRYAALSALVIDPSDNSCSLVASIRTREGEDEILPFLLSVFVEAGVLHPAGYAAGLDDICNRKGNRASEPLDVYRGDEPCLWIQRDFADIRSWLALQELAAIVAPQGMVVELPWASGYQTSGAAGECPRIIFRTGEVHPMLRNGLFYKLEIPIAFDSDQVLNDANALNLMERDALDAPPMIGAWTRNTETGRLSHVGFWPNSLYEKGSATWLMAWMLERYQMALQFLAKRQRFT